MINFSGLASGLDTGAIIDQIVAAERAPAQTLELRRNALTTQKGIVTDLSDKLKSLADAIREIDTVGELRAMKSTSSDDTRIAAAVSSQAQRGSYTMRVNSLAQAQSNTSNVFATADAGVLGDNDIDITVGADAPVNVAWTSADSLYDIASRINDSDARVSATVLFDGTNYRMLVTSDDTGVANAVTFGETGPPQRRLGLSGSETVAASDASFTLSGITITGSSNVLDSVLPGVTFTLESVHDAGDPDTVIDIETDPESQREVVGAVVDAYNEIATLINDQLSYNGEVKGENTLMGDSTLRSLQSALSNIVTSAYPTGASETSLGQIGIDLANDGKLTIDDIELAAVDSTMLEDLFLGDGVDGFLKKLTDQVDLYSRAGDGLLENKNDAIDLRIEGYDKAIEKIELNAARVGEQMLKQFSAMEQAISQMQFQANSLLALFGSNQ